MPILFLKSILGFFTSGFKSVLGFITKYPKQAIMILVCALALYGGMKVKHKFDDLKQQNTELVTKLNHSNAQNTQLKLDVQAAVNVNKENQAVIKTLSIAATEAKGQIEDLKKKQVVIQTKIVTIRESIAQAKPEDDGPVAKVLKDTIDAIQKDREKSE
jgi:chromosome segregation ATPase